MTTKLYILLLVFFYTNCNSSLSNNPLILNKHEKLIVGVWKHDFDDVWDILSEKDKQLIKEKYENTFIHYHKNKSYQVINNNKVINEGKWEITETKESSVILHRKYHKKKECFLMVHLTLEKMTLIPCGKIANEKLKKIS